MVTCQFALYPLRTEEIGPRLETALAELDRLGVSYQVGAMSTELRGDEEVAFAALKAAFQAVARGGEVVLVATVSNAC